jgi:hypothetical protein
MALAGIICLVRHLGVRSGAYTQEWSNRIEKSGMGWKMFAQDRDFIYKY